MASDIGYAQFMVLHVSRLLASVAITLSLVSCGNSSAPTSSATGNTVAITISDFKYIMPARVNSGDVLVLINDDDVLHNLMLLDDSFGIDVAAGETVELPQFKPGKYQFHCHFHLAMTGTLVVD